MVRIIMRVFVIIQGIINCMRVIIYDYKYEEIEPLVKKVGFEIVTKNPDFIISYGGDGTVLKAEYTYPSVPKIVLRGSRICKKCSILSNEEVLKKVKAQKFEIKKIGKLEVHINGKILYAMDNILVHNKDPRHAIRYKVSINGKNMGHEVIGDGVVVATVLGATGYYRSITDSLFEVGIGLAFNNSIEQADHMVLRESSQIKLYIIRGTAEVFADNQEKNIELNDGEELLIKKSDKLVKLVIPK